MSADQLVNSVNSTSRAPAAQAAAWACWWWSDEAVERSAAVASRAGWLAHQLFMQGWACHHKQEVLGRQRMID